MGGLDSPHDENDAEWWQEDASSGVEKVHFPEEIGRDIGRNADEFMTTKGRMMDALFIEGSGVFNESEFTGINQGTYLYAGEVYHSREGLAHTADLKQRFGVKDEEIDGVIKSMTPKGAYVVWLEIENHFTQIQELTKEINDEGEV